MKVIRFILKIALLPVMLAVALIPHIGNWLIERIILIRYMIDDFIRS